jgi:hypothetical protein
MGLAVIMAVKRPGQRETAYAGLSKAALISKNLVLAIETYPYRCSPLSLGIPLHL